MGLWYLWVMSERAPRTARPPGSRKALLTRMQRASNAFYASAATTGVHAFIEFCGLMNEFIMVCRDAETEGIDFRRADTHSGQDLPLRAFRAEYLAEKLKCIYGPSLTKDMEAREAFIKVLFNGQYALTPTERTNGPRLERESTGRAATARRVNGSRTVSHQSHPGARTHG